MSNIDEDEDSSDDVAEDSFKSRQDRIDDDGVGGLESSVDRKIEETKVQSKWSSVGFTGDSEDDDMDEVERLMLEQSLAHSSKQVKPHIDNECDDSDEFAHDDLVHDKTEKPAGGVVDDDDEARYRLMVLSSEIMVMQPALTLIPVGKTWVRTKRL
ncbi:uncharacterized protein IUM83_17733 [Phytophthora cinnamomi]|uniref:uncharacterized protein n=1 Tax=Phytophthora cinnamomi TaxID=4785 RepID=UPI00355A999A|nr:hypothetical protein IUM83_17733 [Phytophthora cinnamomi]